MLATVASWRLAPQANCGYPLTMLNRRRRRSPETLDKGRARSEVPAVSRRSVSISEPELQLLQRLIDASPSQLEAITAAHPDIGGKLDILKVLSDAGISLDKVRYIQS